MDFFKQHWAPLVVAALFAVVLGTVAYRLIAGTIRGAVLAVRKPKQLGESGAVAAEFVIVVIPFLLMLTALMQLSLASMARVLVSYSAFCAARAAMVFVPMKPEEVEGVGNKVGQAFTSEMENNVGYGANTRTDFAISHKAYLIRNAAAYALIPTSPSIDVVAADIANNWAGYIEQRLQNGLNPLDYLSSMLGDLAGVPAAVLEDVADQLKDAIKTGLDSPEQKKAAKDKIDGWLDGALQGNPALRDKVKQAVDQYIDKYQGSNESATGQLGDLVKSTITGTLSGPLEKFKDGVTGAIDGALGSLPGSDTTGAGFKGAQVDRALDAGFGSGTDGAGGAILRSLRKLVYARIGTVVTLLDEGGNFKTKFEWNEPIRARVTYLFYCQIPIANRFAGKAFYNLPNGSVADLATGPLKGFEIVGIPGFFMVMTADHVMTNQGKPD
jgi:hypothetical protein